MATSSQLRCSYVIGGGAVETAPTTGTEATATSLAFSRDTQNIGSSLTGKDTVRRTPVVAPSLPPAADLRPSASNTRASIVLWRDLDETKAFAKDPPTTVFLLSVRSGAVGINLTQANNVFLLEPVRCFSTGILVCVRTRWYADPNIGPYATKLA